MPYTIETNLFSSKTEQALSAWEARTEELLNGLRRYDLNLSKQDVAEMPLFVGAISGPLFWSLVSKKMLIQSEKYFTIFIENV